MLFKNFRIQRVLVLIRYDFEVIPYEILLNLCLHFLGYGENLDAITHRFGCRCHSKKSA